MKIAWKTLLAMTGGASAVAFTALAQHRPRLIWNASASVPIGLYRVQPVAYPRVSDLVVVRPPEALSWFLAEGGYLPHNVPLLKRIAALSGQQVCRTGAEVTVDGVPFGDALARDRRGRALRTGGRRSRSAPARGGPGHACRCAPGVRSRTPDV